jgi:hypothetical protein
VLEHQLQLGIRRTKNPTKVGTLNTGWLNRCFVNLSLQSMNRAASYFQLLVIVRGYGRITFSFERLDAQLDRRLIDANHLVVLVHFNVEGFAERHYQMLFVQLRVALNGFVLNVLGDVAQFGQGFVFQFMVCVCQGVSNLFSSKSNRLCGIRALLKYHVEGRHVESNPKPNPKNYHPRDCVAFVQLQGKASKMTVDPRVLPWAILLNAFIVLIDRLPYS